MAGVCNIFYNNERTNEEQKNVNLVSNKMSFLKSGMLTRTDFTKNFFESVGNYIKWYSSDAKYVDAIKGVYDNDKIIKRFAMYANDLKLIYKPIEGDDKAKELYHEFNSYRIVKREISSLENSDVLKNEEFKRWISQNKNSNVDGFRKHISDELSRMETEIANYQPLAETHKSINKYYSDLINEIAKINPDLLAKMSGGKNETPIDIADQIVIDMKTYQNVDSIKDFYKKIFKADIKKALSLPAHLDMVTIHILDMKKQQAMLHSTIMQNNKNAELKEMIKGVNVETVNHESINALEDEHPLKQIFKDTFHAITERENYQRIFNNYQKMSGATFFDSVFKTLDDIAASKMLSGNQFINNISFKNFLKTRQEVYPELYKASNGKNFDSEKAITELAKYNMEKNTSYKFNNSGFNDALLLREAKNTLRKQLDEFTSNKAKDIISKIKSEHPDYTLVTYNGTPVFGVDMEYEDIKDGNFIVGNLTDLSNPEITMEEAVKIMDLKQNGENAIIKMIDNGDLQLIKKSDIETLERLKKTINANVSNFGLNKINKLFSMTTLFAPWDLPGYMLGTQIWGNIGHTMMADPAAFKHWGKVIKHLREMITKEQYWDEESKSNKTKYVFDYNRIKDEDFRKIIKLLTTSEGGTIVGMSAEDFKMLDDPDFVKDMKEIEESKSNNKSLLKKAWSKWMKKSTTLVSFIETTSRGSMAYEILTKQRKDKVYIPPTGNRLRVEHLWDIDPHLAAVRVANDTHIDYSNLHPVIRKIGRWFPFFSYMGGSSVNMVRQFANTYGAVKEATKTGDWKTAKSYLARGAWAIAWRAGVAALIWNTVMVGMGILSPEKRKQNQDSNKSNIFNSLFGKMGIHLDNNIYIPGTGVKLIDNVLRLGKGNQKGDVFADPESMIPGLDDFWRKDGLSGAVQIAAGKVASRMSPIIKTPIELAMGGGSITESGYIAPRQGTGTFETIVNKITPFAGLGTISRTYFDYIHGNPNEYRSDSAYAVKEFSQKFRDASQDDGTYEARKEIQSRMAHMDVDGTVEAIRAYEHTLQQAGKDSSHIRSSVRNVFTSASLDEMIKRHPENLNGISQDDYKRLQSAIQAQNDFFKTLGYGRW